MNVRQAVALQTQQQLGSLNPNCFGKCPNGNGHLDGNFPFSGLSRGLRFTGFEPLLDPLWLVVFQEKEPATFYVPLSLDAVPTLLGSLIALLVAFIPSRDLSGTNLTLAEFSLVIFQFRWRNR